MATNNPAGYMPAAQQWFQNPGMGYYPGNPVAGFNPMQKQAWGSMQGGAQMGQDFAQQIGQGFMNQFNNPYQVDPNNIPQLNAQQIGQGPQLSAMMLGQGPQVQGQNVQGSNVQGSNIGMGPQVQSAMIGGLPNIETERVGEAGERISADQVGGVPQVGEASMNMFQNPYLTKSIQAGMGQNNRNFEENVLTNLDTGAIGAGQAGSSRHGLAQGVAMGKLNQANLDMASQMNERAYNQGMSNFLNQRGQNINAQTTNAANNLQSQLANQGANLQAAGMNQGDTLSRALANQSAGMQGQIANQQNYLQAQMANQNAGLQGQMANQASWGQNSRANQANQLQAALANQANSLQSQMANQSNNMTGQLANQQLWGQNQRANQAANMMAQQGNQNQWGMNQRANQQYDLMGQSGNAANYLAAMQGNQNNITNMMGSMGGLMGGYNQAMMGPGMVQHMIGNQQQEHQQNQINGEMNRWNWTQQMPQNRLSAFGNMLGMGGDMRNPGYMPPEGMDWGKGLAGFFGAMGG